MFERTRPLARPVTLELDGRPLQAEEGEPLTISLLAAGESVLSRSPKLHRPRGPSCLRSDCDGCLARVDGTPNVTLCGRFARGGERIETQNVIGSRSTDLLRLTDWFFPNGIDHHHLLAGIPGASAVMQTFARQMAGTGRLPDAELAALPATRRRCDVLVVGAGLAGLAAAAALAARGRDVLLVDESEALGGSARGAADAADEVARLASRPAFSTELRATVVGFFEDAALIATETGALTIDAGATVIATGAHDGVLLCEGNDVPGVMSARAVCRLAAMGVLPKGDVALVGEGPWATRAAEALGARVKVRVTDASEVRGVRGSTHVTGIKRGGHVAPVSVVAVDLPAAPAFELAQQLGASAERAGGGFPIRTDEQGRAGDRVWAVGECTGVDFDPEALVRAGHALGEHLARATSPGASR